LYVLCSPPLRTSPYASLFFLTSPASPMIFSLSLHDALPISALVLRQSHWPVLALACGAVLTDWDDEQTTCLRLLHSVHSGLRLRSEEHTSVLQSRSDLVCRLLLEKKKKSK